MTPLPILTLSHGTGLLPVANRLRREGATVEHLPFRHKYERAWEGSLDTVLKGEKKRDAATLAPVIQLAAEGATTVLLDHPRWSELFHVAQSLYGVTPRVTPASPVRACGWWTGETLVAPHLLVVDLGAWTGGYGPPVEGGATLIVGYGALVQHLLEPLFDELKASGHRGLVQAHFTLQTGALTGWEGGWQGLHTHAFLGALVTPLREVLGGAAPALAPLYTVAVPVTVPPWPLACNLASVESPIPMRSPETPGLTPDQLSHILWHDIRLEGGQLRVAGLDGLVGVAYGGAMGMPLAQRRALETATSLRLPEVQLRMDVGQSVPLVQAMLEERGVLG